MENNYLDKMVFKPDYVVKYYGDNIYTLKGMSCNCRHALYVSGYAASKSHPDEPVLVSVSIPLDANVCEGVSNVKVYKLNPDTYLKEAYNGKHDLFIYNLAQNAILAGKEMALYDEADKYIGMCKDATEPIINKINSIINNPFYCHMGQGIAELLTREFEKRKNDFEPTYNNAKEQAKKTYNKAKETVKSGVDKLIDEIKSPNKGTAPFWCEKEQCAFYRELTDQYAVTLKHRINQNGSKYSITIFNLPLGSEKLYNITQEMFHDIYEILSTNDGDCKNKVYAGRLKFNSILDILKDVVNKDIETSQKDEKPAKTKPIQMVEFRDQDVVKSNNLFKRKFNVGDEVVPNKENIRVKYRSHLNEVGTIAYISNTGNKTVYGVKFPNGTVELYSTELNKHEKTKQAYEAPRVKIEYVTPSTNNISDLTQKIKEHDEMLNKIYSAIKDLKK